MKIINLISVLLLIYPTFLKVDTNQFKSGEVIYNVYVADFDTNKSNKDVDQEMKQQIKATNQEILKIQFKLDFNEKQSLFQVVDKLKTDDSGENMALKLASTLVGVSEKYYKNIQTKEKIKISDRYGKNIIYDLPFDEFDWVLTKETKTVNGFKCFKAYTNVKQLNEVTGITKTFTPLVWYCPEIPVSHGPRGLDGLPGLVLEATFNGKITFVANKITFNDKNPKTITEFKGEKIKKVIYEKTK